MAHCNNCKTHITPAGCGCNTGSLSISPEYLNSAHHCDLPTDCCEDIQCLECVTDCQLSNQYSVDYANSTFSVFKGESLDSIVQKLMLWSNPTNQALWNYMVPLFYLKGVTSTSVTLRWGNLLINPDSQDGNPYIETITVQYKNAEGDPPIDWTLVNADPLDAATVSEFTVTNVMVTLNPGSTYKFRLMANYAGDNQDSASVDLYVTIPTE